MPAPKPHRPSGKPAVAVLQACVRFYQCQRRGRNFKQGMRERMHEAAGALQRQSRGSCNNRTAVEALAARLRPAVVADRLHAALRVRRRLGARRLRRLIRRRVAARGVCRLDGAHFCLRHLALPFQRRFLPAARAAPPPLPAHKRRHAQQRCGAAGVARAEGTSCSQQGQGASAGALQGLQTGGGHDQTACAPPAQPQRMQGGGAHLHRR